MRRLPGELNDAASTGLLNFDPEAWKQEVERVTPLLKVTLANDNKDWRIHLQNVSANAQVSSWMVWRHLIA